MVSTHDSASSIKATWRVVRASVTGTRHLQRGKGCEDICAHRFHEASSLLVLAAADGAGSAMYAAQGAQVAVQTALVAAELFLAGQREPDQSDQWDSILYFILRAVRQQLEQLAGGYLHHSQTVPGENNGLFTVASPALDEFATTLLLAIVSPHWLATLQVGDGAIVIYQQDETIISLTPRSQHRYVNESFFVTDKGYLSEANYTSRFCPALRGVALLTDGLQGIAMHNQDNSPHVPFFEPLFHYVHESSSTEDELRRFLESEDVCEQTDDDKTLILAVKQ